VLDGAELPLPEAADADAETVFFTTSEPASMDSAGACRDERREW